MRESMSQFTVERATACIEEVEQQLPKIKMVRASERVKEWGMQAGLNRLESFQQNSKSQCVWESECE